MMVEPLALVPRRHRRRHRLRHYHLLEVDLSLLAMVSVLLDVATFRQPVPE